MTSGEKDAITVKKRAAMRSPRRLLLLQGPQQQPMAMMGWKQMSFTHAKKPVLV
jgi:hypothetical protein